MKQQPPSEAVVVMRRRTLGRGRVAAKQAPVHRHVPRKRIQRRCNGEKEPHPAVPIPVVNRRVRVQRVKDAHEHDRLRQRVLHRVRKVRETLPSVIVATQRLHKAEPQRQYAEHGHRVQVDLVAPRRVKHVDARLNHGRRAQPRARQVKAEAALDVDNHLDQRSENIGDKLLAKREPTEWRLENLAQRREQKPPAGRLRHKVERTD